MRRAHEVAPPPGQLGRHAPASSRVVGELADERADVGDDAERLVAAPVGQLGDDGLVDVDAERLDPGGQAVAGGDGVQRRRQHQRHRDAGEVGPHGVGGRRRCR